MSSIIFRINHLKKNTHKKKLNKAQVNLVIDN
jgi:hypothetical protein